jgi:hypothetical protein
MPNWLTSKLCRPIRQLCPIWTRLSILVPAPMTGRPEGAAVNGGASADLHVVADLHMPKLRHLDMPAPLQAVAKSIGPDHRPGVDDDAVAQDRAGIQHDVGVQLHVVPQPTVAAHDHARRQVYPRPDDHARLDRRPGGNRRPGAEPNAGVDHRAGMDEGGTLGWPRRAGVARSGRSASADRPTGSAPCPVPSRHRPRLAPARPRRAN